MSDKYTAHFLSPAQEYIASITEVEQGAIAVDVETMCAGELQIPKTKQLRGSMRELISGYHRITYVIIGNSIYFIRGFRKKSGKTPKSEIDYAEKTSRLLKAGLK